MALRINSVNQNTKRKIDLSKIDKAARATLRALGKKDAEVNIVILSNQAIRALNRKYLKRDRSTDVIAFPAGKELKGEGKGPKYFGDIAISSDKAATNAREYGTKFTEEVALYVIHGTLHLAGYTDTGKKDRARMQRKENELLQKIRTFLR